jgi:cytochrome c biogenesis protein CcmG, thiol:disulfide interchange protein DsbE
VTARQQWAAVLVVVAMLALGLGAAMHFAGDEIFPVTVGSKAPAFSGTTVPAAGSVATATRTLADYRGQVVLLNVWATWCEPCRVEMPSLQALHEQLGPKGLKVVALSVDDPGADGAIALFAQQYRLTFQLLHDAASAVKVAYQTTGVPETFVIGRDGVIRKKVIGAVDWNSDANRRLITELLAERAP